MTGSEAIKFVEKHGVVLESARGPVPSLVDAVVGEKMRGSWWGHPKGGEIFALTRCLRSSRDILVCRLINGKVTYVHRRLWPALIRLDKHLSANGLTAIREVHTLVGTHRVEVTPYPQWVPQSAMKAAKKLSEQQAAKALGSWFRLGNRR
jgi:hypothetical protein